MSESSGVSFVSFGGDFAELASAMRQSWSENSEQHADYDEVFLRSIFEQPGASLDLAPAIYRDGKLLTFCTSFPRDFRWHGHQAKFVICAFLTVTSGAKGHGYGPRTWREVGPRARAAGFDGQVDYFVEGGDMNRNIVKHAPTLTPPFVKIASIPFLSRLIWGIEETSSSQRLSVDPHLLVRLGNGLSASLPLARVWNYEQADWVCNRRAGAVSVVHQVGTRSGIITGYVMGLLGTAARCVFIDNLLWGDLDGAERVQLVQEFLIRAGEAGAKMAVAAVLGYADVQPLEVAGFNPTKRVINAYLTLWSEALPKATPLDSLYLDVF